MFVLKDLCHKFSWGFSLSTIALETTGESLDVVEYFAGGLQCRLPHSKTETLIS